MGQTILRRDIKPMPAAGRPAAVPRLVPLARVGALLRRASAGGMPVAVIQLVSSERDLGAALDAARLAQLGGYLREVVREICKLLETRR